MSSRDWRFGPGLLLAATGVGAGDLITASVAGAKFGTVLLWAVVVGAVFKYVISEALGRRQLAVGQTFLEDLNQGFPKAVGYTFMAYLFLWGFVVAGALSASCGMAAHAVFPGLPLSIWGIIHAVIAWALVRYGRFEVFEGLMKIMIGGMFLIVLLSAGIVIIKEGLDWQGLLVPSMPGNGTTFVVGIIGGVGGSVTLLSYGYWMRESGWRQPGNITLVRKDLGLAYGLTGLFGIAMLIIAAGLQPGDLKGGQMVTALAAQLGQIGGPIFQWTFLLGFWGAVFSSMLGVWQGVPYIFADRQTQPQKTNADAEALALQKNLDLKQTGAYRGFLLFLAFPPLLLLLIDKPLWIVILYAVTGALFMPFLGACLWWSTKKAAEMGGLKTGKLGMAALIFVVLFFAVVAGQKILETLNG